jgi:hypothetical protein
MQAIFLNNEQAVNAFRATISEARFARYLKEAAGNAVHAIELYHWNALLSQSMYLPLQMWEVSLRNKLNQFLIFKYNAKWPYDDRALRTLTGNENRRLRDTKLRFDPGNLGAQIPTDAIVADLSAGFWVSLLSKRYDVPFAWRYNLARVFPHGGKVDRAVASATCDRLLDLRNRIAHHEPIWQLNLPEMRADLDVLAGGMCTSGSAYINIACTFAGVWKARPPSH